MHSRKTLIDAYAFLYLDAPSEDYKRRHKAFVEERFPGLWPSVEAEIARRQAPRRKGKAQEARDLTRDEG